MAPCSKVVGRPWFIVTIVCQQKFRFRLSDFRIKSPGLEIQYSRISSSRIFWKRSSKFPTNYLLSSTACQYISKVYSQQRVKVWATHSDQAQNNSGSRFKARFDEPFTHAFTALRRDFNIWKRKPLCFQPIEKFLLKTQNTAFWVLRTLLRNLWYNLFVININLWCKNCEDCVATLLESRTVISNLKTQMHAVNTRRKRVSQLSFSFVSQGRSFSYI